VQAVWNYPGRFQRRIYYTLAALNGLPLPKSREVVIFGGAGGGSVTMTDMAERIGLKVPPLPRESIEKMETVMPLAGHSVKNPIDLVPAFFNRDFMMEIISVVKDEPNLGAMIIYIFTPGPVPGNLMNMGAKGMDGFCRNMAGAKEQLGQPLAFVLERDTDIIRSNLMAELEKRFREIGLMVFPTFDLAAKALVNLSRYQEFLSTQK
jgi:acyl-CoA synthetase (NDP forming)